MNIQEAKLIRIVDYLRRLGYSSVKMRSDQHWYLSPLHEEKTPSFKVNDRENLWYDFALADGGDLIELGKYLYRTSDIRVVLQKLEECAGWEELRIRSPNVPQKTVEADIRVDGIRPLTNTALLSYVKSRDVDEAIAQCFCREIHYTRNSRRYFGICFENRSGGYEVRNAYFKGCIKNKDITIIPYSSDITQPRVCIFEGFMDFLAYLTLEGKGDEAVCTTSQADYIVLNSVGNLKKCLERLDAYEYIHCYLDNDLAGKKTVETICGLFGDKVVDESVRYAGYKDVNDFLRGKSQSMRDI